MKTLLKAKNGILLKTVVVAFFFLFSASPAFAGFCDVEIVTCGRNGQAMCNFCSIFDIIDRIITFVITCLVPTLATLFLVIGGITMLISTGNPTTFNKAKAIITAVIVGVVIIFLSWAFLNTFFTYLGVTVWTGTDNNWWQVKCD